MIEVGTQLRCKQTERELITEGQVYMVISVDPYKFIIRCNNNMPAGYKWEEFPIFFFPLTLKRNLPAWW